MYSISTCMTLGWCYVIVLVNKENSFNLSIAVYEFGHSMTKLHWVDSKRVNLQINHTTMEI